MKKDIVLNERIYQLIREQIECGLLPKGARLPSRADLCEEFQVSAKTVRRVLERLAQEGLIETSKRKLPVVTGAGAEGEKERPAHVLEDGMLVNDLFQTGRIICYPVIQQGVERCTDEDWKIPQGIVEKMDPANSLEFWRLSRRFWRFFIARNGNDLILRAVDSLGFSKIDPLPGSLSLREAYLEKIGEFIRIAGCGGELGGLHFEDLSFLYGLSDDGPLGRNLCRVAADSPLHTGLKGLEQRIRSAEERYSRVYMDLLGLIDVGRYRPGDRLPSHLELQKNYGVSADTTNKAIRVLQDWGVVTAKRGSGIYVAMDLNALKQAHIPEEMIACHLRRFLDSIELLCLTVSGVASHIAAHVQPKEAETLLAELRRQWDEEYLYQRTPVSLLTFITTHIQYTALREIYQVIGENFCIGRCIPKLVTPVKTAGNRELHREILEAVECLSKGEEGIFSERTGKIFWNIRQRIIDECKKLGYLQIAGQVYDGRSLWQERNITMAEGRKELFLKQGRTEK